MSIEEQKEELDSVTRTAMKWKQEIDKLNAETDKKIEEFNKMTKKSKEWRKRE
jgi:cell division protein FtsB|tara:strand:- start:867 stop:1025 length:159 start_codon:yes stop_codon:yes gene_type:complete